MATLIGHLVGFDIRALRQRLAVWGLVLAGEAVVLLAGPDRLGADPRLPINYDMAVLIVRVALTSILAALLVQADALVGTTAFWRTRPIRRWSLLASKLSSAAVMLVLLPTLVIFLVFLALGLQTGSALRGAATVAAEQSLVLVFVMAAAAVTANLAHFVIAVLAGFTVVALSTGLLPALLLASTGLRAAVLAWSRLVFTTVAVIGAIVAMAHQFLTLRTARSMGVMAAALLVATGSASFWPRQVEPARPRGVDPSVLAAEAVRIELDPIGWGAFTRLRGSVRTRGWQLSAFVRVSGEPADILVRPVAIESTLTAGGRAIAQWRNATASGVVSDVTRPGERSQPYRSVRVALGGAELGLPRGVMGQRYRLGLVETAEDTYAALQDAAGVLDATLTLRAFRYAVTARAPVAPGGTLLLRDRRATIVAIGSPQPVSGMEPPREGINLTLRDTDVTNPASFAFGTPASYYLLYNASRRQAVFAMPHSQRTFRATLGLLGPSLPMARTGSLQLEYDPAQSDASFAVDDEWIRGAELIRMEPEDLGVITRPLRLEGLRTERPKTGAKSPNA